MNDKITIQSEGKKPLEFHVPDFGEYKIIVQNGKVYRIESTTSELIKNK